MRRALVPVSLFVLVACTSPSPGSDAGSPDAGSPDAGSFDAGNSDAGSRDAGTDAGPDAGADGGQAGLRCGLLLSCDQNCTSNACTDNCYAESTAVAQGLFNALDDCINAACPSSDGGACASSSSSQCSSCQMSAATGACITELLSCEGDMTVGPADPDGGSVVLNGMDAGPLLDCGELIACQSACPEDGGSCTMSCVDQATPEARALEGALNGCLAMACPSTDGGPCETAGAACSGCIDQAEYAMPNICAAPFNACNSDTSNSRDGGAVPTALQGGTLSTVVSGIVQDASAIAAQGGNLYYAETTSDSQVVQFSLTGGTKTQIGPPLQGPVGLVADSNNVYVWSTGTFSGTSAINNGDGNVVQIPLSGSTPITLEGDMEVFYNAPYVNSIAVDSANVYWVAGGVGNDGVIMKTAIGSANPTPIYSGQYLPEAIATDGTNVYWGNWGTFNTQGISNGDGAVMQGSVSGGTPLTLASNLTAPGAIAIDSQNVYWTSPGKLGASLLPAPNTGTVLQVPIGGGTVTTLAGTQAIALGIAVQAGVVYWTEYGLSSPGLVMSVPAGGGTIVPLVAGLPDPFELIVSGNTLYWTNTPSSNGGGAIMSLSPL